MHSTLIMWFCIYRIYCEQIVYTETSLGQTNIDCSTRDCTNDEIYFAGASLTISCNAPGACNGLKVYCGTFDPPQSGYNINNMDGGSVNCLILQTQGSSSNIYFYCNGDNVNSCTFRHYTAGITSSTLECNVKSTASCQYSCDSANYCDSSNSLLCHPNSACSCFNNQCGNITPTPYTLTTTTSPPITTTTTTTTTSPPITTTTTSPPITTTTTSPLITTSTSPPITTTTASPPITTTTSPPITTTTIETTTTSTTIETATTTTTNPTPSPTAYPTASPTANPFVTKNDNPTLSPSDIPSKEKNNNDGEANTTPLSADNAENARFEEKKNDEVKAELDILIILLSILIILVILVALFILMKKRKKGENKKSMDIISTSSWSNTEIHVEAEHIEMNEVFNGQQEKEPGSPITGIPIIEVDDDDDDDGEDDGFYCRVLYDYIDGDDDQLNLKEDELVYIMRVTESGWWFGIDENGLNGWIPSNYLYRLKEEEEEELKQQQKQQEMNDDDNDNDDIQLLTKGMDESYNNIKNNDVMHMDKYINMPPQIPAVSIVTVEGGDDDIDSDDDDDDEMYIKSTEKTKGIFLSEVDSDLNLLQVVNETVEEIDNNDSDDDNDNDNDKYNEMYSKSQQKTKGEQLDLSLLEIDNETNGNI